MAQEIAVEVASDNCPIPATHDKVDESHYFLHRMLQEVHEPHPFRWNLNAFLHAMRSVEHMLKSELGQRSDFATWYGPWAKALRAEPLIKRIVDGRNIIVHDGMLHRRSRIEAGRFKHGRIAFGFNFPLDVDASSASALRNVVAHFTGEYIDEEHSAIGEQLGVRRVWVVEELTDTDEDVLVVCHNAWLRIRELVVDAHKLTGMTYPNEDETNDSHNPNRYNLLLESDLDSSLLTKWDL